jgi:hypothetical protein
VSSRYEPSEGVFLYILGLVVIATSPDRFWLGFLLSAIPILIGVLHRVTSGVRWRP